MSSSISGIPGGVATGFVTQATTSAEDSNRPVAILKKEPTEKKNLRSRISESEMTTGMFDARMIQVEEDRNEIKRQKLNLLQKYYETKIANMTQKTSVDVLSLAASMNKEN